MMLEADRLNSPLLDAGPSARPAARSRPDGTAAPAPGTHNSKALRRLRRVVVHQLSRDKAERAPVVGKPQLAEAREHVRFFLPKNSSGELLSLRCSEAEFSAHVGVGVSLYMRFVKMTGYMFAAASVVATPQLVGNFFGNALGLPDPFTNVCHPKEAKSFMEWVTSLFGSLSYFFFASLLGNASFSQAEGGTSLSHGWLHLVSELILSSMFCIYVYWIWQHNSHALAQQEETVRASDFAVCVRKLPAHHTDPHAIKAHFSFFGPLASVALANDNAPLLKLVERQQALTARWRRLHLLYAQEQRAPEPSRKKLAALLQQIGTQLGALLHGARALREARKLPAPCTGYAFVVFRRMRDAAKCVRHFELIRRHERSRDGVTDNVDFRQLYFRSSAKLDVSRACEPSDVIWQNLKFGRRRLNAQNVKTTLYVFGVACVSTTFITLANYAAQSGAAAPGLLTTVWVTAVVIVSNVAIFVMVPVLAVNAEVHHYRSTQQTHMLLKMAFFQVFNTTVATLVFLFIKWQPPPPPACPGAPPPPPPPMEPDTGSCVGVLATGGYRSDEDSWGIRPDCVQHWYRTGAFVLMNALFGDLTLILFVIELLRPDKLITRYILAPRAASQVEMNAHYAQNADFYLPFRYQLVIKQVVLTLTFCSAVPLLLPYAALFMLFSYKIDRYNLLRVMNPPPRTTERTISMSVLYILPLAVFLHLFMALFFYSKRASMQVPFLYFAILAVLAVFIMVRISAELASQARRPIKEAPERDDDGEAASHAREMAEIDAGGFAPSPRADGGGWPAAGPPSEMLKAHLDSLELYVPPLTTTLLNSLYEQSAERVVRPDPAPDPGRAAPEPRPGPSGSGAPDEDAPSAARGAPV